jgi:hypothetical protein
VQRTVIERPGITDVLIPTGIIRLRRIAFVPERFASEAVRRELSAPVATRTLPTTVAEALALVDAPSGIENRMLTAGSLDDVTSRYPVAAIEQLVGWMIATVDEPGHVVTGTALPGLAPVQVRVLDQLNLAALDPNIARMLALYWVDPEPGAGLYVVAARYAQPGIKDVDASHSVTMPRHRRSSAAPFAPNSCPASATAVRTRPAGSVSPGARAKAAESRDRRSSTSTGTWTTEVPASPHTAHTS